MIPRAIKPVVILFAPQNIDIGRYCQSISIDKSLDYPAGTMSITLNPAIAINEGIDDLPEILINSTTDLSYWMSVIRPYTPIACKIDGDNAEGFTLFGLVTEIYESVSAEGSSTSRAIKINCASFLPKILMSDKIVTSQSLFSSQDKRISEIFSIGNLQFFKNIRMADNEGNVFVGRKPIEAVNAILANAIVTKKAVVSNQKGEVKVIDFKKDFFGFEKDGVLDFDKVLEYEWLYNPELTTYTGTVLSYIMECLDMFFYEVFFDTVTIDGQPFSKLIIRTKPFTHLDIDKKITKSIDNGWSFWEDLIPVKINSDIRLSENLGYSEKEIFTYFQLVYTNSIFAVGVVEKLGFNYPIINTDLIAQYGIRELKAESRLSVDLAEMTKNIEEQRAMGEAKFQDAEAFREFLAKRERLVEWNAFPYYQSGQISVIGDENYTIGTKVFYEDKPYSYNLLMGDKYETREGIGMEFYVNSVSHNYSFPNFFRTELTVIRGQARGLVAEWYIANQKNFIKTDVFNKTSQKAVDDLSERRKRAKLLQEMTVSLPEEL